MVRLITAFACALVANADYICTTTSAASTDCQCLTMIDPSLDDQVTGPFTVWLMGPGAENGQSDFTIRYHIDPYGGAYGTISYKFPDGQELCVTHPSDGEGDFHPPTMAPYDYGGEGGFFILGSDGLLHVGEHVDGRRRECLEPCSLLDNGCTGGLLAVGECSSSWTMSPTPLCSSKGEMVIA